MISVAVGHEQVRGRQSLALDDVHQRLERSAAVDEHRGSAGLVGEQEGVGEPGRVHASLDDHGRESYGRIPPSLAESARFARKF